MIYIALNILIVCQKPSQAREEYTDLGEELAEGEQLLELTPGELHHQTAEQFQRQKVEQLEEEQGEQAHEELHEQQADHLQEQTRQQNQEPRVELRSKKLG